MSHLLQAPTTARVERMEFTVENVCGLLIRSKLLTPDEVKVMYQRWQADAKEGAADLARFTRWLVARQYVTEYQAALVAKGHVDSFFIGPYKILDRLGRGRMAAVYRAVHKLGQVVAIKILPPSKNKDPQILGRFQREARLALKLKHPNVIRSFQVGAQSGVHYLVMEYLEGETLETVLHRRKRLPAHEAVRLVYQALQGLHHIHDNGLVHRDLKPANLMLVPAHAPGGPDNTLQATLKILDIGLGRSLFDGVARDLHLTGEGVLLGTPDYLAPEQARDARGVDIRADVYSLGCVLYHCLTGQPPFPDTNVLVQVVRHATEAPRPVRELAPDAPEGLQQVLNWMLAKDPAKRYPTPERAAQALQAFQVPGAEPARMSEEGPHLGRFLTWLESDPDILAKQPDGPSTPIPVKAVPVGTRDADQRHRDKKHKRHKHRVAATAATATTPTPRIDVELVPAAASGKRRFRLSTRDWLLMGAGAVVVILAGVLGIVLANTFQ